MNQSLLAEYLRYCPDTGIFTWIRDSGARKVKNLIAGRVQHGYRTIQIKGKKYTAHRLAFLYMTGSFPPDQVDHINHTKDDNRWLNLRLATYSDNAKNHPMQRNNKSGVTGVMWDKKKSLWMAAIKNDCKSIYLGRRKDKFEAICLRKSAENKYMYHPNHGRGLA